MLKFKLKGRKPVGRPIRATRVDSGIEGPVAGTGHGDEDGGERLLRDGGGRSGGDGESGGGDSGFLDPATITGGTDTPVRERKKRGPNKAKNKPLDIVDIRDTLVTSHFLAANFLRCPEIALTADQAETMARAASRLSEYYDFQIAGKTAAIVNFAIAFGGVYAGKAAAIYNRAKDGASNVHRFPQHQGAPA